MKGKTKCQRPERALREMQMEEVDIFMNDFLPSYNKTLDELQEI